MKPYVICHMMSSLDGRIKQTNWSIRNPAKVFEDTASKIKVDAWIVGRTTMQEFSHKTDRAAQNAIPAVTNKKDFVAKRRGKTFAVAIDPSGKCRWNTNMVDTDYVIEVLTKKVSLAYLAQLRAANVSYIFAGTTQLNLRVALEKLHLLFGIRRVRIDGGGTVNGSFLRSGLIDEFSHVLVPLVDGTIGSPSVFDVDNGGTSRRAATMKLKSVTRMRGGILWCRYRVRK